MILQCHLFLVIIFLIINTGPDYQDKTFIPLKTLKGWFSALKDNQSLPVWLNAGNTQINVDKDDLCEAESGAGWRFVNCRPGDHLTTRRIASLDPAVFIVHRRCCWGWHWARGTAVSWQKRATQLTCRFLLL